MKIIPALISTILFSLPAAFAESSKTPATATKTSTGAASADPGSATAAADEKLFDDSFSSLPTNITADSLTLNSKERVFAYKGNVTVTQGDMTLVSKTLEGTYDESNQIQKLIAKGDVVITRQDIRATSQRALYEAATATVTLLDSPQLTQVESILTADRIKVFLNENRSQAEGAVRVTLVNKDGNTTLPGAEKEKAPSATAQAATLTPAPTPTPILRPTPGQKPR